MRPRVGTRGLLSRASARRTRVDVSCGSVSHPGRKVVLMRTWSRYFGGVTGIVSLWGLTASAGGESCSLELKKVDSSAGSRENYIYRATSSQSFYKPIGDGVRIHDEQGAAKFADIIQKEPGNYRAEYPIRGTVKLGSLVFGFVLDTSVEPKKKEEAAKAKSRTECPAERVQGRTVRWFAVDPLRMVDGREERRAEKADGVSARAVRSTLFRLGPRRRPDG